ncbi:hypothetical protein GO988_08875 [Hymenobacter sp. HMF4947]|uniref:Uncharacterized protein n=1 Tax=Hymenobacter ginkgonis TaxID=2682976 RepID=A0A7K1TDF5_9BACT|nr:hypothetical protein [Hymenobacter ginkgonis]MVN76436.1 hypothetical protein [Hymenobacter ginkgonis]
MLEQQQLMSLFAALSDAISAHENASDRVKGTEQQKPKNVDTANYIAYKELEAASAWQARMDAAIAELTEKEVELRETQGQVLAALPEAVKRRIEKNIPVIIGEGNKFLGLYQRGKELAVLTDQHEQTLYSKIFSYYQQPARERGRIQGMIENLY